MKSNQIAKAQILEIVDNQINSGEPPETRRTLERLQKLGISKQDSKIYIAQCVAVEVFQIITYHKPFDEGRYIANLNKLPEPPFEDDEN
jgi:hypothetical protein